MQEEITQKTITLSIQATKFTANLLKQSLLKLLNEIEKQRKNPKIYKGKQTVKQLIGQNAGITNIEIADKNIKSFEVVARKYGIDFALKKDTTLSPPKYLVFFKARDTDAMTAAFREFTSKTINQKKKPSILKQLNHAKSLLKQNTITDKTKNKERSR